MYNSEERNGAAASEVASSGFKERFAVAAKGGFLLLTAVLAVQIFMKAVYFAHL